MVSCPPLNPRTDVNRRALKASPSRARRLFPKATVRFNRDVSALTIRDNVVIGSIGQLLLCGR
jgi:hypothetical protein